MPLVRWCPCFQVSCFEVSCFEVGDPPTSGDRPFWETRTRDNVGSGKEENTSKFGHFGSLKTYGYDGHNGEKELCQLLQLRIRWVAKRKRINNVTVELSGWEVLLAMLNEKYVRTIPVILSANFVQRNEKSSDEWTNQQQGQICTGELRLPVWRPVTALRANFSKGTQTSYCTPCQ